MHILTGPVGSGKTTCAGEVARLLAKRGIRVDGFLSRAVLPDAGGAGEAGGTDAPESGADPATGEAQDTADAARPKPLGYDLVDLASGAAEPFIRREGGPDWQRVGKYALAPSGIAAAERIIERGRTAAVLIVDEVGSLELEGGGLWPALERAFDAASAEFLLVIREIKVAEFMKILPPGKIKVFNVGDTAVTTGPGAATVAIKDLAVLIAASLKTAVKGGS